MKNPPQTKRLKDLDLYYGPGESPGDIRGKSATNHRGGLSFGDGGGLTLKSPGQRLRAAQTVGTRRAGAAAHGVDVGEAPTSKANPATGGASAEVITGDDVLAASAEWAAREALDSQRPVVWPRLF